MSERELHNLGAADERSPRIAFTLPCYDRQTPGKLSWGIYLENFASSSLT